MNAMIHRMDFHWYSDIDFTDASLPAENVELVFQEAIRRLQATAMIYKTMYTKANNLIGFVLVLSAGLLTQIAGKTISPIMLLPVLFYFVAAGVSLTHAIMVIWDKTFHADGYRPEHLFLRKYMYQPKTTLTAQLIKRYGKRIAENTRETNRMSRWLKRSTLWFVIGSAQLAAVFLAAKCLPTIIGWTSVIVTAPRC